MNEEIEQLEKTTLAYANKAPLVLSLLYDIDMMPEQIAAAAGAWEKRRTRDWYRMLLIVSALHFAAEGKSIAPEPGCSQNAEVSHCEPEAPRGNSKTNL
jgi:hypothetical protein